MLLAQGLVQKIVGFVQEITCLKNLLSFQFLFFVDATGRSCPKNGTRSCPKNRSKKFSVQKHRAEETEITVASYCRVLAALSAT